MPTNIYLYGNCQTTALRRLMLEANPDWTVDNLEVSAVPNITDAVVAAHLKRAAEADIVITQPLAAYRDRADLSSKHLVASLPPRVTVLHLPSMFFNGLHGAFDYLTGHLPGHRSPYHSAHTIDMYLAGYQWQDIALIQCAPEFYTRDFTLRCIDAALAELRRREKNSATEVHFSRFLEERCRTEVVMNTVNHPKRPALVDTLRQIFRLLGLPGDVSEAGEECIPFPTYPPLPTVLHHLGLPDVSPTVIFHDGEMSRSDDILASLRHYAPFGRQTLRKRYATSRLGGFIEAFRQAPLPAFDLLQAENPKVVAVSSHLFVEEMFPLLLRRTATVEDIALHARTVEDVGVTAWLTVMMQTPEYQSRVRPA